MYIAVAPRRRAQSPARPPAQEGLARGGGLCFLPALARPQSRAVVGRMEKQCVDIRCKEFVIALILLFKKKHCSS